MKVSPTSQPTLYADLQPYTEELLASEHYPLLGVELTAGETGNVSPSNPIEPAPDQLQLEPYTNFRTVRWTQLRDLRLRIASDDLSAPMRTWLNKLLRYTEVRYADLRRNERRAGRSPLASSEVFAHLLALFTEAYFRTEDLTYLNVALKVADLRWARPPAPLPDPVTALWAVKSTHLDLAVNALRP